MGAPNPLLFISEILDTYTRKNFEQLRDYFASNNQFDGFKMLEFTIAANEANKKIAHGQKSSPKDIIVTRLLAPSGAKITFNHGLFTSEYIDVTVTGLSSGSMKVRLLVGTFQNSTGDVAVTSTETQEFKSKL